MTPDSLEMLEAALYASVVRGELAGAAALTWRPADGVQGRFAGRRDVDQNLPLTRDTLFRIASLTKPVTTVAALTLLDEGRIALDEPITRYAPELSDLRVLVDPEGPLNQTRGWERPITFGDLLTHRAGFTYAEFHAGPIGSAYAEALGGQIDNVLAPDEWISRLATLPLIDRPGGGFHYGVSTDLLGFLLARVEGTTLESVVRQRVLDPLGMDDTHFVVPVDKRHRRAALSGFDATGRATTLATAPGHHALAERPDTMTFVSGGQGLWSTVDDYLVFARLFADGGAVDGVRILAPETCARMMTNQLTPDERRSTRMLGQAMFAEGHGYGMGVAVVMEPERADPLRCRGGVGTVGWPGAYGSWWQADPTDRSVMVFLSHNMVDLSQMSQGIGLGVWGAIATFHQLAQA